ncbi:MAG: acyl-CoA dehydrogenase [Sphingomonadales bacterium]|nr:acyl-CoA dehydrogenase [Sphingomonadales bacterium]
MASLDLDLSDEQVQLRDAVHRLVAAIERPDWQDLTHKLGLGGLTLPEVAGGFGGGMIAVALVMAELGPALAGADWLSHAAACAALGAAEPDHPLAGALVEGRVRAALIGPASAASLPHVRDDDRIEGTAGLVAGGAEAALFVLAADGGLFVVDSDAAGLTREPRKMLDGSLAADLHFAGVVARPLKGRAGAPNAMVRAGRCAEAVGLMQRMVADTAAFLNQRRQFGAPIASFQVLRHRLADMQLAALQAQALTEAAVIAIECAEHGEALALDSARLAIHDAARVVGEGAVQLHGAMGLTEELSLGARFKRLLAISAGLGDEAGLIRQLAPV